MHEKRCCFFLPHFGLCNSCALSNKSVCNAQHHLCVGNIISTVSLYFFVVQLCVQNSPQEARNMLLQNPQLAYALLQAQVVMRIVDPEIALVRIILK